MTTPSILRGPPVPSKPALAHDPDVCYLDGETPCEACRLAHEARERDRAAVDYADYRERCRIRKDIDVACDEMGISENQLKRLLPALGRLLLPVQAEGMAEIAGAVMDEWGTA